MCVIICILFHFTVAWNYIGLCIHNLFCWCKIGQCKFYLYHSILMLLESTFNDLVTFENDVYVWNNYAWQWIMHEQQFTLFVSKMMRLDWSCLALIGSGQYKNYNSQVDATYTNYTNVLIDVAFVYFHLLGHLIKHHKLYYLHYYVSISFAIPFRLGSKKFYELASQLCALLNRWLFISIIWTQITKHWNK